MYAIVEGQHSKTVFVYALAIYGIYMNKMYSIKK